jgi:hypothetical protein
MNWRNIGIGAAVVVLAFLGASFAMQHLWPGGQARKPALVSVPPLAPLTRSSTIVAPAVITLAAIRDAMEQQAPREMSGKPEIPALPFVANADVAWSVMRGQLAVSGDAGAITVSAPLNGSFHASGQVSVPSGSLRNLPNELTGIIGGLLGGNVGAAGGQNEQSSGKAVDQRTDIRGRAAVTARPSLLSDWRLDPHLSAQVALADASLSLMGVKVSVPEQVKPLLDQAVNEQVTQLQGQLRNNPMLELTARREWAKMCRSVSLGAAGSGMPNLWLEIRPTRAFAAQPRIDQSAVTLTLGVQADTRIVPNETKPDCPFPAQLEIVPQLEQGHVNVALPIDIPFTELNRLLEAQLKGKVFPEDKSSAFTATIRSLSLAASGDRLLISVGVRANETKSWFGFGADATVHVWGRPTLDASKQILRLSDVSLDVESQAAFGVLGAAAHAAIPYLEKALADHAVVELAPLVETARQSMTAAITEFRRRSDGVAVEADLADLQLTGIAFDATTLRVIGEAHGSARATITKLDLR